MKYNELEKRLLKFGCYPPPQEATMRTPAVVQSNNGENIHDKQS